MEIYIIELPKFEKYRENISNSNLNLWVKFIKNPEVVDMSNKKIKFMVDIIKILCYINVAAKKKLCKIMYRLL